MAKAVTTRRQWKNVLKMLRGFKKRGGKPMWSLISS
jgi:hypothetical protein